MRDEELDHWAMNVWCDPEHPWHDHLAAELEDATNMEYDEMVACFAWLQDPANRFAQMHRQCTAEDIATLFEEHLVEVHSSWEWFAEQWGDAQSGKALLTGMMSAARSLGHQDALFEILARMGEVIAHSERPHLWWFHAATIPDGRMFALERPTISPQEE